ncbi:DUF6510 family protein [Microbacterium sp. BWT-B31]|uniref:DUF6510 family protein n=1 Tax=Microbacterium sp. BWT-B31 TaxID=3232072 RepID=UPI0035298BCC
MRASNARSVVDGNAIAGILSDVFVQDTTALVGVCGGCGAVAPIAEAVVEIDETAAIVRCRSCTRTLFTVLRIDGRMRLVVSALRSWDGPDSPADPVDIAAET